MVTAVTVTVFLKNLESDSKGMENDFHFMHAKEGYKFHCNLLFCFIFNNNMCYLYVRIISHIILGKKITKKFRYS